MTFTQVFIGAMQELTLQLLNFIPKLIVALLIWIVGKYLIGLLVSLVRKVKLEHAKPVNKLMESLAFILEPLGKVLLFLIVMDYLGIGSSVISALVSGFTFAIAIALGLAFGKALEDDAKQIVAAVKKQLEK